MYLSKQAFTPNLAPKALLENWMLEFLLKTVGGHSAGYMNINPATKLLTNNQSCLCNVCVLGGAQW